VEVRVSDLQRATPVTRLVARNLLWGPRHSSGYDFALVYPDTAMSHEMIPAITTRIEYWATSLLNSL
jgi:hypothetical protein